MASSGRTESDGTVGPLLWLHLYIWTDVNYYSMLSEYANGKRPCPRSGLQARYQTAKQQQNSRVFDAGVTYNPNPVTLGISGRAVNVICARHRSGGFL